MTWKDRATQIRNQPKWLGKDTTFTVLVNKAPEETTIQGNYGVRKVFIVETEEFGLIYLNPQMFAVVSSAIMELPEGTDTYTVTI